MVVTELVHVEVFEVVSAAMRQQSGAADPETVIAIVRALLGAGLIRPAHWGPIAAFMYLADLDPGEFQRAMRETFVQVRAANAAASSASTVTE